MIDANRTQSQYIPWVKPLCADTIVSKCSVSFPGSQRVHHRARWHAREKMWTIRSHTESERPSTTQGKTFWNVVCSFAWKSYQFTVDKATFFLNRFQSSLLSFRGLAREGFLPFDPGALVPWKTRLTTGDESTFKLWFVLNICVSFV